MTLPPVVKPDPNLVRSVSYCNALHNRFVMLRSLRLGILFYGRMWAISPFVTNFGTGTRFARTIAA